MHPVARYIDSPPWPACGRGARPPDRPGCLGAVVPGHRVCLAHLSDPECTAYVESLSPGADLDHRGTRFTPALLRALLTSLRSPASGVTLLGHARFDAAFFPEDAVFDGVVFASEVSFRDTYVSQRASFQRAVFETAPTFGPLRAKWLDLSSAVFGAAVVVEVVAETVVCDRTRWESTATLRLRGGGLSLRGAVLSHPMAVLTYPVEVVPPPESPLSDLAVESLSGVDAAHLVLTNVDLSWCEFAGAFHLDQLRLEGHFLFRRTPSGLHVRGLLPYRWTRRLTLAEEHYWRAKVQRDRWERARFLKPLLGDLIARETGYAAGWAVGPNRPWTATPTALAADYRQLRKAFEDAKNEPGAADFYYGEMEMRRKDRNRTPLAERFLLWWYWLLSGYGLRASRALGWLGASLIATVLALMVWGLPNSPPRPETTGTLPSTGQQLVLTTRVPVPYLSGPLSERLTRARLNKAVGVALNSSVFRASSQNLTSAGTYIEMASRFVEPVLLALVLLAIRGRVKR